MKNAPKGWLRINPVVVYHEAAAAIDWLCRVFDFQVRLKVEDDDGRIVHCELVYGDGVIMPAQEGGGASAALLSNAASPKSLGGKFTQSLCLYVDDVEAHCKKARAGGATIFYEPKVSDYGDDHWADKSYGAIDLEGHYWWFSERIRDPKS